MCDLGDNWMEMVLSVGDFGHDVPLYRCQDEHEWKNGLIGRWCLNEFMLSGKSIGFNILGTRSVCHGELKPGKEACPSCLSLG